MPKTPTFDLPLVFLNTIKTSENQPKFFLSLKKRYIGMEISALPQVKMFFFCGTIARQIIAWLILGKVTKCELLVCRHFSSNLARTSSLSFQALTRIDHMYIWKLYATDKAKYSNQLIIISSFVYITYK